MTLVVQQTADFLTCNALLSQRLRERRGRGWGQICRTVALVPADAQMPVLCSYCRARLL